MLQGNEFEKEFDNGAGKMFVDVDSKGKVVIALNYNKEQDLGGMAQVKAGVALSAQTDIFVIAEKLAAKTEAKWDDAAIVALKNLLGIKSE
jgi:hypothetical protein